MSNKFEYNFILVGPKSSGKSSTANTLLAYSERHPHFNVRDQIDQTGRLKIKLINAKYEAKNGEQSRCYLAGKCVGLGETSRSETSKRGENRTSLPCFEEFSEESVKQKLVGHEFCFLFCIKFESNKNHKLILRPCFRDAGEQFCYVFGNEAIKSTVLIVIIENDYEKDEQVSLTYEHLMFKLYNSEVYIYLKEKNNNEDIPFVLWDNCSIYYSNKIENLKSELEKLLKEQHKMYSFSEEKLQLINKNLQDHYGMFLFIIFSFLNEIKNDLIFSATRSRGNVKKFLSLGEFFSTRS